MVEEKVTYMDETQVKVDINRLGFRKSNAIAKKHIPINNLTIGKDESMSIKGDLDLLGMSESCLETIPGLDLDKISGEEATRIYKKYFEKDVMSGLGQGKPNPK